MTILTVALTGHRPGELGGYNLQSPINKRITSILTNTLVELLEEDDDRIIQCVSGMALGADTLWALTVLDVRESYPGRILLHCAVPHYEHGSNWPDASQKTHLDILNQSDEQIVIIKDTYSNAPYALQKRNEYMVNMADVLIAVYTGVRGGTKNCIDYAKKKNKTIYIFNPKDTNTDTATYSILDNEVKSHQPFQTSLPVLTKDILTVDSGIIIHQVNCRGVMGAGLARQIKTAYPRVFNSYKQLVDRSEASMLMGRAQVIRTKENSNLFVCNLYAQEFFGNDHKQYTHYPSIEKGLKNLASRIVDKNMSIHIPYGLGAGLGGGDSSIILEIIEKHLPSATLYKLPT